MEEHGLDRRTFLAAAAPAAVSLAPATASFRAILPSGEPAGEGALKSLLAIDANGRAFELLPTPKGEGTATLELPPGRFELMMPLPVSGFGNVYLYADNAGSLYTAAGLQGREVLLTYEFARSRAAFVRRYVEASRKEGVAFTPAVSGRLERGEALAKKAAAEPRMEARAGLANESLSETMWAGETAAIERARHRIAKAGARPGFLFGCNAFGYAGSNDYAARYGELLNFATLPFYRAFAEKVEGQPDYSRVDAILDKMRGAGMLTKGHPLVWFHRAGVPEFLKTKNYDQVRASCRDYILRSVGRYRDRIHSWDVINEAHDWANDLNMTAEQLIEMTRLAAVTTREADPTAFRVVNSCCTWAEYVATRRSYSGPLGRKANTPLDYMKACEDAKIPYEAIGLQVYWPHRDMLEVERHLERFFRFGKPIHITELGISSSSEPQASGENRQPSRAVWHGDAWTEEIQADWTEQFYTICYSKPLIEAITWWDFADPAFIPHGGFLRPDKSPKAVYDRLKRLFASWRA